MTVAAILLDKDGTLVDFARTWGHATVSVLRTLARGDERLFERLTMLARLDPTTATFHADSPVIAGSLGDFGPDWARACGLSPDNAFLTAVDGLFRAHARESLVAVPGAVAVVEDLAATGMPLGLATNDAEATAAEHLEALGIAGCFGFVAGYDSGYGAKPQPGMIHAFASHVGCRAAEIALIGDSLHDLAAAKAAGAIAVAVATGPAPLDVLRPHADVAAPDIATALVRLGLRQNQTRR